MLDYHGNKTSPLSGFNPHKIALLSEKVLLYITGANIRGNKVETQYIENGKLIGITGSNSIKGIICVLRYRHLNSKYT